MKIEYENVFLINSPIQYLMARMVASSHFGGRHLAIVYKDGGHYEGIFEEIDLQFLGASPFDIMNFDDAMASSFSRPKRLFISYRFFRYPVETYFKLKPEILCAYEDGFSLHINHDYGNKSLNDKNPKYLVSDTLKALARFTGLRPHAYPKFLRTKLFDEVYSIFPYGAGFREDVKYFSTRKAFEESLKIRQPNSTGAGECLFLSQPLSTIGMMESKEYIRLLRVILTDLVRKYDRVYFKPHPRDSEEVLGAIAEYPKCLLLPKIYQRVPAEIYVGRFPETDVYGFMTSTLFYVPSIFGTKAFSLAPILEKWPGGNQKLRDYWSAMRPMLIKADVQTYEPAFEAEDFNGK